METSLQTGLQPPIQLANRAFGEKLALARHQYVTYIPAILLFAGVLSWTAGNEFGLVLASAVASLVAFYTLIDWLFHRGPTRFSTLLAMSLQLGYGFGTLNTWFSLPRGSLTLGQVWGLDESVLARGMGAVLFASATLYFLGEIFEKPIFGQEFCFEIDGKMRTLIYAGALAMFGGYATHRLVIGGISSSEGHASIVGMLLSWLYPPLASVAVAGFLTAQNARTRFFMSLTSFAYLAFFAVLGRRATIYTTVEILLVLALVRYQWRGNRIRSILTFLAIGALIVASALVFMLLRIAPSAQSSTRQVSTLKRFQEADKLVQRGQALELATVAMQQNAQTRTFVLAFLANVLDASSRMTPALGRDAVSLMEYSIPSAIYPEKSTTFSEEGLVDQQFGFSYGDQANSVLTAGATDFGLVGMIIYPVLLIILVRVVYGIMEKYLKKNALIIVTLAFIYMFLQTESTLTSYTTTLRNSIIFGVVIAILMAIPGFRIGSQL